MHQLLVDLGVNSDTAHTVQVWTISPLRILLIVVVAWILTRVERRYAVRMVRSLRAAPPILQPSPRARARATTLAGVVSAVVRAVIWVIAGLAILSQLGIDLGAFVAGATVLGAALGFGAQTLVKDFLSGMLILAEDQYEVGDNIVVNNTTGTVEGMTLRVTRIRSIDGVVWYVPNGDVRTVGNNSEGDSVALAEVLVPLGTDLVTAGRVIEEEAKRMAAEPDWAKVIVGEPTFAGIAAVDKDGATLRVMARTVPGEHMRASRELRLRFLERIRQDQLAWVPLATSVGAPMGPGMPAAGAAPATPSGPARAHDPEARNAEAHDTAEASTAREATDETEGLDVRETDAGAGEEPPAPPTPRASSTPPRRWRLPRWRGGRR